MVLNAGRVFYSIWDKPSHRKIVVTITEGIVAFVHATTNKELVERDCRRVENKWKNQKLHTMIFLPAGCCTDFLENRWVDCNAASSEEELLLIADRTFQETQSTIPDNYLGQIKVGISSSHLVPDKIRKMVVDSMPKIR